MSICIIPLHSVAHCSQSQDTPFQTLISYLNNPLLDTCPISFAVLSHLNQVSDYFFCSATRSPVDVQHSSRSQWLYYNVTAYAGLRIPILKMRWPWYHETEIQRMRICMLMRRHLYIEWPEEILHSWVLGYIYKILKKLIFFTPIIWVTCINNHWHLTVISCYPIILGT